MPKGDVERKIDTPGGRARRRAITRDLYNQFLSRPGGQPDDVPPAVPTNASFYGGVATGILIGAVIVWDDCTDEDFDCYPLRYKMDDPGSDSPPSVWSHGVAGSSRFQMPGMSYYGSGSIGVSAQDIWGNQSGYSDTLEFNIWEIPPWPFPTLDAPTVGVTACGGDYVLTVECATASQIDSIHSVVYEVFE